MESQGKGQRSLQLLCSGALGTEVDSGATCLGLDASLTFFFFCLTLFFKIYCFKLFVGAVMQENLRFASSGDDVKIWDASSMTLVDKFNPHTSLHGISSLCWSSNSIL